MRMSLGMCSLASLILFLCSPAEAHFPNETDPIAFLHIASNVLHSTSFAVMGIMCELYRGYSGGSSYGWIFLAPFVLLLSHAHVPFQSGNGLVFALGFAAAGYFVAILFAWFFRPVMRRFFETQQADSENRN